jgi:hypothetical protein
VVCVVAFLALRGARVARRPVAPVNVNG